MSEQIWKDENISLKMVFLVYAAVITIFLIPLIPIIFNWIDDLTRYFIMVYPIIIIAEIIVSFYVFFERIKHVSVTVEGIHFRWYPVTKADIFVVKWKHIKRISLFSTWSPKLYVKWKKIHNNLSLQFIISSLWDSKMVIIETKEDKAFLLEVRNLKGFMYALGDLSRNNPEISEMPVIKY